MRAGIATAALDVSFTSTLAAPAPRDINRSGRGAMIGTPFQVAVREAPFGTLHQAPGQTTDPMRKSCCFIQFVRARLVIRD
jgi:hypothetical protein